MERNRESSQPAQPRVVGVCLALLMGLLLLNTVPVLNYLPNRDASAYGYGSFVVAQGGRLYVDAWIDKPPLLPLVGATMARLLGSNLATLHWTALLVNTVSTLLFFLVGWRWWGLVPATVASGLFAWAVSSVLFEGGFMTENLAVMFQLASFALFLPWIRAKQLRWLFLAGLAGGLAVMARQASITLLVAQVALLVLVSRSQKFPASKTARSAALLGMGWMLPSAIGFLWAAFEHLLTEYVGAVYSYRLFNPDVSPSKPYLATISASGGSLLLPIFLIAVSLGILIYRRNFATSQMYLWAWLLAEVGGILLLGGKFPHYMIPVLAPTLLIGAGTVQAFLYASKNFRLRWSVRALGVAALSLLAWPWMQSQWSYLHGPDWVQTETGYRLRYDEVFQAEAVAFLRGRSSQGVLVFGHDPAIYLLANVRSPNRFFYSLPLSTENATGEFLQENRQVFLEEFSGCPPEYVLIKVPPALQPYEASVANFPEFQVLLDSSYSVQEATLHGYQAFRRIAESPGAQCNGTGRLSS